MPDPIRPVLDKGFVTLIDEPNSDLKVVNAARVSFAKKSATLEERDIRLIQYLARNKHWTPFAHCRFLYALRFAYPEDREACLDLLEQMQHEGLSWTIRDCSSRLLISTSLWTAMRWSLPVPLAVCQAYRAVDPADVEEGFGVHLLENQEQPVNWSLWPEEEPVTLHIKMPLFVAAQWKRSTVGIVYNEVSRRYVDDAPEFHVPSRWRKRPDKSIKQGSSDEEVRIDGSNTLHSISIAREFYSYLIQEEVAPEQARIVLPVSTYTELWMTCSLRAIARVVKLRLDPHAQWEVRQYAAAVRDLLVPKYPILEKLIKEETHG